MLNNRAEILKDAREVRTRQIAEDRERVAALVEDLIPPQVTHPPDDGSGMIYWTRDEQEKLLTLCRHAKNKAGNVLNWPGINDNGRKYFAFKIVEALQDKFFPPYRRRTISTASALPFSIQATFRDIFELKDPAKELLATSLSPVITTALHVPEATPVPRGHVSWTADEETALLTHLAKAMRKQWGNHIPPPDDRTGCIMFKDMIVAAQNETIPQHRRRDLTNARSVLEKAGMMPRLQKLIEEMAPVAAATATPPHTNGHANGQTNGHAKPEPAKLNIEAASLADLLRAVADKIEATFAKVERENAETKALCDELLTDNSALRQTVTGLEHRLGALQHDLGGPSIITKRQLPRVAILGCHLDEYTNIMAKAREHGLELEFKHYDQDQIPVQIKGDYALMLKWASPAWMQKMKESGISADRRAIVQGGISRAVMQLEAWFAPEPEPVHARAI